MTLISVQQEYIDTVNAEERIREELLQDEDDDKDLLSVRRTK